MAVIKQGIAVMKDTSASDAAIALAEKARDSAIHKCHQASEDARNCINKLLATLTARTAMLESQKGLQQKEMEGLEASVAAVSVKLDIKVSDQSLKVLLYPLHPQCVDCNISSCLLLSILSCCSSKQT